MLLRVLSQSSSSSRKSRWKSFLLGCRLDLLSSEAPPIAATAAAPGSLDDGAPTLVPLRQYSSSWTPPHELPRTRFSFACRTGNGSVAPWCFTPAREAHCGGLYVQHTTPGTSRDSAAVSIGVIHALERLIPGMGYFRPIDKTTIGGNRAQLMKEIYGFKDSVESMQGVSQQRALEFLTQNKTDDLMEDIFKAYDALKRRHDFLVIEGTNLRGFGGDIVRLNARIASMLGSASLLVVDARGAMQGSGTKRNAEEYQQEVLESAKMSDIVFKEENVDVLGTVVHGMPAGIRNKEVLHDLFKEINVPFAGVIPDDPLLHTVQVQDVVSTLGAEVTYGGRDEGTAMSTEITNFIVATSHLSHLLGYIPSHSDPTKGTVVISDATRSDILLGLLNLRESNTFHNLAALVLTGGFRPEKHIEVLVQEQASKGLLPVILSPLPSFETSALLSRIEPAIQGNSFKKIERAQQIFEDHVDTDVIAKAVLKERAVRMNPKLFQHNLFEQAKRQKQHIVLPEGEEPRTIQAAAAAIRRDLAEITLLGNAEKIRTAAEQLRVDISQATVIDPSTSANLDKYAEYFYELRKKKGVTKEQARTTLLEDVNYFGTCMVAVGDADGMVSGAIHTTANTVRPALQIIKTFPDLPLVSSVFFMCLPDKVLVYGDCAINSNPTSEELAAIAIQSADTAAAFGVEPKVAMLSYATGTSNTGPLIQKVADATAIAKSKRPDLLIEGPLQYDTAVNPETAKTKMKTDSSPVAGKATVLIFPDLNTGNNTYKAVQQSTGAVAMGPLLQGLRKPVNDLSRGCTVVDIMTTIALTAVQAIAMKSNQPEPEPEPEPKEPAKAAAAA
ncbi:unnamed protein product [Calypogeia fissa]